MNLNSGSGMFFMLKKLAIFLKRIKIIKKKMFGLQFIVNTCEKDYL